MITRSTPIAEQRWLPVRNVTEEEIPGCAAMSIVGRGDDGAYLVGFPNVFGTLVVNSQMPIAAGAVGAATRDAPARVLYETDNGEPAAGEEWGPVGGSFALQPGGAGFSIHGSPDGTTVMAEWPVCPGGTGGGGSGSGSGSGGDCPAVDYGDSPATSIDEDDDPDRPYRTGGTPYNVTITLHWLRLLEFPPFDALEHTVLASNDGDTDKYVDQMFAGDSAINTDGGSQDLLLRTTAAGGGIYELTLGETAYPSNFLVEFVDEWIYPTPAQVSCDGYLFGGGSVFVFGPSLARIGWRMVCPSLTITIQ